MHLLTLGAIPGASCATEFAECKESGPATTGVVDSHRAISQAFAGYRRREELQPRRLSYVWQTATYRAEVDQNARLLIAWAALPMGGLIASVVFGIFAATTSRRRILQRKRTIAAT